jgi:hypothetical protein
MKITESRVSITNSSNNPEYNPKVINIQNIGSGKHFNRKENQTRSTPR